MRGHTREQLEAKGATLANYVLCDNCGLYWHKRAFKRHLNVPPSVKVADETPVAVIHPAWERFIDFLVKTAIDQLMKEQADRIARGEPVVASPSEPGPQRPKGQRALSVDEAAERFGVTRESILAEFERHAVPFSVKLTPLSSRKSRRVRSTGLL